MAFTHTVAHQAATVNTPATSSKNEFATGVAVGSTPNRHYTFRNTRPIINLDRIVAGLDLG